MPRNHWGRMEWKDYKRQMIREFAWRFILRNARGYIHNVSLTWMLTRDLNKGDTNRHSNVERGKKAHKTSLLLLLFKTGFLCSLFCVALAVLEINLDQALLELRELPASGT